MKKTMINKITKTKYQLLKEFRKVRTDAISEMFDNADEHGIYPTTKFFNTLDSFLFTALDIIIDRTLKEIEKIADKKIKNSKKHL